MIRARIKYGIDKAETFFKKLCLCSAVKKFANLLLVIFFRIGKPFFASYFDF